MTDIFTVTFWRDSPWLELLCYSVQRYASGFRSHLVLIPRRDESICRPIVERYGSTPVIIDEVGNGNLFQCAAKSHAYLYSDAETILYLDSDCWLTRPATPADFMQDGKPLLLFTPYAVINSAGYDVNFTPWQQGTENAIGHPVENEYMRRMGQMHLTPLLRDAMQRLETRHGKPSWNYIVECPPTWHSQGMSPGYSEFNYLGAVAATWPERYACLNTVSDSIPDTPVNQGWSHKHPTQSHKRTEIERELKINVDDLFGIKILPSNIAVPILDTHLAKWTEQQGRIDTDPTVRARVCPLIQAGATVIDGGAAIGDWTLPLAEACGANGTVIAYEPNLIQFRCLVHNVAGRKGIVCHNAALGSVKGFCEMVGNDNNMGASYIREVGNGRIKISVIDDLELSRCDLIKLDVESYELFALHGAIATIKRCRPILIVEMNRCMERVGLVYADMFAFLDSIGYSYAPLCPQDSTLESHQYDLLARPILSRPAPSILSLSAQYEPEKCIAAAG